MKISKKYYKQQNIISRIKDVCPDYGIQTSAIVLSVNQVGYDSDKTKRGTIINAPNDTDFYVKRASDDKTLFKGKVRNQIADFTPLAINTDDEMYLEYGGQKSFNFKIKDNLIENISLPLALKFMEMARQDKFRGSATGYAWRDSHQFSFELNSLVMMYMSNPDYYENLPWDVYKINTCEYSELQTQTEPNIIWLMKFAVTRYYNWCINDNVQLHALIKAQLPYFLYIYPNISQYVTNDFYTQIRDFTINQCSVETCNKSWYEVDGDINHNLFTTQEKIGTVKGQLPPGYAIIPNLMMYEVAKRDGLDTAEQFLTSAINNITWLVNEVDLDDPSNTKGQRMSEYITMTSLCYAYELYSDKCPEGTYEKIERWADVMISRSNNPWDFRQYTAIGDLTGSTENVYVSVTTVPGLQNQPGNVAGFASCCYAVARVLTNELKKKKLKTLAISHLDHVFGRNPVNRFMCYTATDEFEGADRNWFSRYQGGHGNILEEGVVGALDGAPKNAHYPCNPIANDGYSEAWVAFNTAWNTSLAYLCAENPDINGIGIFNKNK